MFESSGHILITLPYVVVYAVAAFFILRFFWKGYKKNTVALDVDLVQARLESVEADVRKEFGRARSGINEGEREAHDVTYYVHRIRLEQDEPEGATVRLESRTPLGKAGAPITIERRKADGRYQAHGTASRIATSNPVMFVIKSLFFLVILFVLLRGLWLPAINAM